MRGQPDHPVGAGVIDPRLDPVLVRIDAGGRDGREGPGLEVDLEQRQRVRIDVGRLFFVEAEHQALGHEGLVSPVRASHFDIATDAAEGRVLQGVLDVSDPDLESLRGLGLGHDASCPRRLGATLLSPSFDCNLDVEGRGRFRIKACLAPGSSNAREANDSPKALLSMQSSGPGIPIRGAGVPALTRGDRGRLPPAVLLWMESGYPHAAARYCMGDVGGERGGLLRAFDRPSSASGYGGTSLSNDRLASESAGSVGADARACSSHLSLGRGDDRQQPRGKQRANGTACFVEPLHIV